MPLFFLRGGVPAVFHQQFWDVVDTDLSSFLLFSSLVSIISEGALVFFIRNVVLAQASKSAVLSEHVVLP